MSALAVALLAVGYFALCVYLFGWGFKDERKQGYQHALDDVMDEALDRHNPCHDEVRDWIISEGRKR